MRSSLAEWLFAAALALCACGGNVVVDGQGVPGGGGAGGGTTSSSGGDPCAGKSCGEACVPCQSCAGICDLDGACVLGKDVTCGPPDPCLGASCGLDCVVCNDVECLQGVCDGVGNCWSVPVNCF